MATLHLPISLRDVPQESLNQGLLHAETSVTSIGVDGSSVHFLHNFSSLNVLSMLSLD